MNELIELNCEPDSAECTALNDLCGALASGKKSEVVKMLRAIEHLDGSAAKSAIGLMADLLDDEPSLRGLYPWCLKLAARGVGRPPKDPLFAAAKRTSIFWAVLTALAEEKKLTGAVKAVSASRKISESAVWKAWGYFDKSAAL